MYPTIAVEGSDSFDAISRTFSYVFSRLAGGPVRPRGSGLRRDHLSFREAVRLRRPHGDAFVRRLGRHRRRQPPAPVGRQAGRALDHPDVRPPVRSDQLGGDVRGSCPSWLVNMWVFLVAAAVGAYLLSYAASSTSVIYFLLRRKVDATDLDEVYVEEPPQELEGEVIPAEAPAPGPPPRASPPPRKLPPRGSRPRRVEYGYPAGLRRNAKARFLWSFDESWVDRNRLPGPDGDLGEIRVRRVEQVVPFGRHDNAWDSQNRRGTEAIQTSPICCAAAGGGEDAHVSGSRLDSTRVTSRSSNDASNRTYSLRSRPGPR